LAVSLLLTALLTRGQETNPLTGPTIHLRYGKGAEKANPVQDFMYFVPLISPAPVSSGTTPECTQAVHVVSAKRRESSHSFTATCELKLDGQGQQQSTFDLSPGIRRHLKELKDGGAIHHQLKGIEVRGAGAFTVEVKGAVSNDVEKVGEVRLRFNAHGHTSPVWIDLCDIQGVNGEFKITNEVVARVNALTFRSDEEPPKMEVSIASVKNKGAGDGFWANLKGGIVGMAANLAVPPLKIEAAGNQAMLDFGHALVLGTPDFTFPFAHNLRLTPIKN
jgi:hypothetical protein